MPATSGSPTQIRTSVSTAADLAGTPDDQFKNGDLASVDALYPNSTFRLNRESVWTADNVNCIDTFTGNGKWECYPGVLSTDQVIWYIDAVSGDDSNTGATALTALATWAEFERRVHTIGADTTVYLLTDLATDDPIVGSFSAVGGLHTLSIIGTPAELDTGVIATRTIPTIANAEGTLIATGIAAWTVGALVEVTASGTPTDVGLGTVVMADVAGTAQVPFWVNDTTDQLPAVGATVRMFNGSTAKCIQLATQNVVVSVRYVWFDDVDAAASSFVDGPLAIYRECQFSNVVESGFAQTNYVACAFLDGADLNAGTPQNAAYVSGGGIFSAQTFDQGGYIRFDGTISYAAIVLGSDRGAGFMALEGNGIGVFGSASAGVTVGAGSQLFVGATAPSLYGDGNTTYGLLVRDGGRVRIDTSTPSITGTTAAVSLDTQTTVVPLPIAGDLAIGAAANLTTWAHWTTLSRVAVNWAWTGAGPVGAASQSSIIGT